MRWPYLFLLLAVYSLGTARHLDTRATGDEVVWGDTGDGLFNSWVLQYGTRRITTHPRLLADPPLFWPQGAHSFFWSDTLLAWTPFFRIAQWRTPSDLQAFQQTIHWISLLHYLSLCFLFHQIVRTLHPRHFTPLPWCARGLVAALAYGAHFSFPVLINHFLHVQNFAALGVFLLMGLVLAYRHRARATHLAGMAGVLALTCWTAPYYALAGGLVLLPWVIMELRERPSLLLRLSWRSAAISIPALWLAAWIGYQYLLADSAHHPITEIKRYAIGWQDFWIPPAGWMRSLWATTFQPLRVAHAEKIVWPGIGVWLAIGVAVYPVWSHLKRITPLLLASRARVVFVSLMLTLLLIKSRELRPFTAIAGVLFIGGAGYVLCAWIARRSTNEKEWAIGYLLLITVLFYGIALGPRAYYIREPLNPSIWGLFAAWVPGFMSIRAIGRLAYVGHVACIGLLTLILWPPPTALNRRRRGLYTGLVIGLLSLQIAETGSLTAQHTRISIPALTPTRTESAFWETISGPVLVLPIHPYHRNPAHMHYFSHFPSVFLMNGYSGRSTEFFDELMHIEAVQGPYSPHLIARAREQGGRYIAYRRDGLPPPPPEWEKSVEPIFLSARWQVIQVSPHGNHD